MLWWIVNFRKAVWNVMFYDSIFIWRENDKSPLFIAENPESSLSVPRYRITQRGQRNWDEINRTSTIHVWHCWHLWFHCRSWLHRMVCSISPHLFIVTSTLLDNKINAHLKNSGFKFSPPHGNILVCCCFYNIQH